MEPSGRAARRRTQPNAQLGGGDSLIDCSAASAGDRVVLLCGGQTWTWDGAGWSQQPVTGPFVELAAMTSLGSAAWSSAAGTA